VGRYIHHFNTPTQNVDRIAIGNAHCLKRDPEPIGSGCYDFCLRPFAQQFWGPTDVIGVMVGLKDCGQTYPVGLEPMIHWISHCWIHDDGVFAPNPDPNHVVM
jgi:hypothetical protein